MYIGHVGAALAAKRVRATIGLLPLLLAAYTPDWVDTATCLAGRFDSREMFSHSIPAVLLLALIGCAVYALLTRDWRGGLVIGAVIVSHMLLDWITGQKPTWPGGPLIGLGLYDRPVADFIAEAVTIVVGVAMYRRTLPPRLRPWRDAAIMLTVLLAMQLTIDV